MTTCIHNVLSGPRWIEHYGEVLIRNTRDAAYHCKITFGKVRPTRRDMLRHVMTRLVVSHPIPTFPMATSYSNTPSPYPIALPLSHWRLI